MNDKSDVDALTPRIMQIIQEKKPRNVKELVIFTKENLQLTEKQTLDLILEIQSQGKIKLESAPNTVSPNLSSYLKTSQTLWYWITIAIAMLTLVVVFIIPENLQPWRNLQHVLGTIFVLWLPGYTFIKALFPIHVPIKTSTQTLDSIERIALSLGMSLAIVPLVGLFLNYTPWGIRLAPIVLSIFMLTVIFATTALIREHQVKLKLPTETTA